MNNILPEKNGNFDCAQLKMNPLTMYLSFGLVIALATFFRIFNLSERGIEGIEMVYNRPVHTLLYENELVYYYVKPGYLFLLYLVGQVFDYSTDTLLIVSAISGILSVALVFFIAKRLFNPTVGLLSALVLAIMPYHVWISRMGMAYSPGIFLFAFTLLIYLFTLNTSKTKKVFLLFWAIGFLNGVMFTIHPGLIGCAISLFLFDFFYFLGKPSNDSLPVRFIYRFLPKWLFFSAFFLVPLLLCEFAIRDILSGNSFISSFSGIKVTADSFLRPSYYFWQLKAFALGANEIWSKWTYGENLGYDYYLRILMRELGFFNFFLVFGGVFFINFLFWKKKISIEQTFLANMLLFGFLYWTFNPRIFFARRNFTPAIIPAAVISGFVLYYLLQRKVFYAVLSLVAIGSVALSWQYVSVKTKFGHLTDYLRKNNIHEVMILPGIVYPENPLLGAKGIKSLNLELYSKLYCGIKPEQIPNHIIVTDYLICYLPEIEILGEKFKATDKITADVPLYNGELFSYTFEDVFPWRKIGVRSDVTLFYIYNLKGKTETVKQAFIITRGETPWSTGGHLALGGFYEYYGKLKEAEKEYRMALDSQKSPLRLDGIFKIAELFFKNGRYDKSETYFKKVIEALTKSRQIKMGEEKLQGRQMDWGRMALGTSMERLGQISAIRKSHELHPGSGGE